MSTSLLSSLIQGKKNQAKFGIDTLLVIVKLASEYFFLLFCFLVGKDFEKSALPIFDVLQMFFND